MSYEVTATRKRPQGFETLVGQDFVVSTLSSAVSSGRIAHAYLFSGPRGVGKTSAARLLAKALNCEKGPTPAPCGECSSCQEISRGNSLDVIEIDGASNTSVNDVREIKDEVLFAPNSGRYKVYIIDEVHMLSNSAFNALLKTIEEPPPYIVFIFATTEIHKVPATIRSRCQQFNFRLIQPETIKNKLAEAAAELQIEAEDEALFWIAKEATGSLRDAYTLFDQVASFSDKGITLEEIRQKLGLVGLERINGVAEALAEEDAGKAIELTESVLADGVAVEQFIIDLTEYFRNLLFIRHGIKKEAVLGYSPERFSSKARDAWSVSQMETAIELLFTLYREIRYSLNQRFELELVMSRLAGMRSYLSPKEVLHQIGKLRSELVEGKLPLGQQQVAGSDNDVPETEPPRSPQIREHAPPQEQVSQAADQSVSQKASNPVHEKSHSDSLSSEEGEEAPPKNSHAVVGQTEQAEGPRNLSQEEIQQTIDSLRKTKPALVSALEKAGTWHLEGETLSIDFENGFTVNFVRGEIPILADALLPVIGFRPAVKLNAISKEQQQEENDDTEVRLVTEVFRGEVIGPKGEKK
ncbi:DNA polymerase III subunit gamma/tau [Sediminispirochaeta smaragdinae]|uniref:DNA polymerase III subunit gamma/tau n=1 Tax=Sediminispirochaeta smaragdinae (strain DSM 11293 / JCM 15392 / SEBR 4228) TaxID=573413 RepID=E1R8A4_SEDSS|nr:DNA polymerase III subunit gamma/tau [Sediminispirochaeta smaragdinae]ADK79248.1 DNA polymerase III, subunits gamma and tau [Sediminispirochaeta smaragdinae DSM 11293]